jgi:hypothetical protein
VLARIQSLSEGSSMLGKEVSFAGADGKEQTSVVDSVYVAETGDVRLKLQNGEEIDMRQVIGIAQSGSTPATSTTA